MRGRLVSLILVLSLSAVSAFELHFEQQNTRYATCKGGDFDTDLALRNDTLYQQVYQWMHQQDVQDWTYATKNRSNDTEPSTCALVSYKTLVASPTFFARLLRNFHMSVQFPIAVQKLVCLDGSAVFETSTVSAPLIHDLTMTVRYDVQAAHVDAVVDAHYSLPWYIDVLVDDVAQHLRANFKEKIDAVAQTLCAPMPPLGGLVRPEHSYLRGHTHHPTHPTHPTRPTHATRPTRPGQGHAGHDRGHANPDTHPRP
jgi:hypothetical protein